MYYNLVNRNPPLVISTGLLDVLTLDISIVPC